MTEVSTNDYIESSAYRATDTVTTREAYDAEQQFEQSIVADLRSQRATLNGIALRAADTSGDLSAHDIKTVLDAAGTPPFTWNDLQNMVAQNVISQDVAELMLAVTTVANSDIGTEDGSGTLSRSEVAAAVNRLYNETDSEDREFILDTFKEQGAYSRVFNIDSSKKHDSYSYTLTDSAGSVVDLPSTAEIDRAIMFLTASTYPTDANGDMVKGSPTAFINWDFDTSGDEVAAMLGRMDSYDSFPTDYWDEIATMITKAGTRATETDVYTPTTATSAQVTAADADIAKEQEWVTQATKLKRYFDLNGYDHMNLNRTSLTIDGVTKKLGEWITDLKITVPNKDRNDNYTTNEVNQIKANIDTMLAVHQKKIEVDQAIKAGLPQADIDAMMKSYADFKNAAMALQVVSASKKDSSAATIDYDNGFNTNSYNASTLNKMLYTDPTTGEESYIPLKSYLKESGAIFCDTNSSGFKYDGHYADSDMLFNRHERTGMELGLTAVMNEAAANVDAAMYHDKSTFTGYTDKAAAYTSAVDAKADFEKCMAAIWAAGSYNGAGHSSTMDLGKIEFKDHTGSWVSALSFLQSQKNNAVVGDATNGLFHAVVSSDPATTTSYTLNDSQLNPMLTWYNDNYKSVLDANIASAKQDLDALTAPVFRTFDTDVHDNESTLADGDIVMGDAAWDAIISGDKDKKDKHGRVKWDDSEVHQFDEFENPFEDKTWKKIRRNTKDDTETDFKVDKKGRIRNEEGDLVEKKDGKPLTYNKLLTAYNNGNDNLLRSLGISEGDMIDIGMLMYTVMSNRMQVIGDQIMRITREQAKNTNDQANVNAIVAAINCGDDPVNCDTKEVTLTDGTKTTLTAAMQLYGISITGSDHSLSGDEISTQAELVKENGDGLGREGQMIMNELTQLSQKYQQTITQMMNFLEKTDALKQKLIDKIRAN